MLKFASTLEAFTYVNSIAFFKARVFFFFFFFFFLLLLGNKKNSIFFWLWYTNRTIYYNLFLYFRSIMDLRTIPTSAILTQSAWLMFRTGESWFCTFRSPGYCSCIVWTVPYVGTNHRPIAQYKSAPVVRSLLNINSTYYIKCACSPWWLPHCSSSYWCDTVNTLTPVQYNLTGNKFTFLSDAGVKQYFYIEIN